MWKTQQIIQEIRTEVQNHRLSINSNKDGEKGVGTTVTRWEFIQFN